MTITIVCVCGHHNSVLDEDFECSYCTRCLRRLLPATGAAEVDPTPLAASAPLRIAESRL